MRARLGWVLILGAILATGSSAQEAPARPDRATSPERPTSPVRETAPVEPVDPRPRLFEPEVGGAGLRKYTVLDTRRARTLLEEAHAQLRAGATRQGLAKLQTILSEHPSELIRDAETLGRYRGAGSIATEWIWSLNAEEAALYVELHEPKARALMEAAGTPPSRPLLARLVAEYPRTPSALEASRRILDLDLEHGENDAALASADRLLARPDLSPALRLETLVQAMRAAAETEAWERFERYRGEAVGIDVDPSARPRFRGEPIDAGALAERLAAAAPVGRANALVDAEGRIVSVDRSPRVPRRHLESLVRPRWTLPLVNPLQEAKNLLHTAPPLPFEPAVADERVFVANGFSLRALHLLTGDVLWSSDSPMEKELARVRLSERNGLLEPQSPHLLFSAAIGPRVVVTNLQFPHLVKKDSWRNFDIWQTLPERRLFAFDRETGKLLWSHWRPLSGPTEEETVTAPPVIGMGLVLAEAHRIEGKVSSYAVAFDAQTGERVWKTYLLTGQEDLNMFGRLFMEHPATPPVLSDGVAYFGTNLGLVAAVDAATGRILWMAEYESIPIRSNTHPSAMPRIFYWFNNRPLVADGVLIVTPLDSKYLYAFDARTGERLWDLRYDELGDAPLRYVVGAGDGRVVVSGRQVYAFDLRTGAHLWQGMPRDSESYALTGNVGRGCIVDGVLYFPTREGLEVLDVAAQGKKLLPTIGWPATSGQVPGHVTLDEGAVLLAGDGPSHMGLLQVAFDPNALTDEVPATVPGSETALGAEELLDLARMKLLTEEWEDAIALFESAVAAAEDVPALRARELGDQARQGLQRSRLGLGDALLAEGRLLEARRAYRQAWSSGGLAGVSVRALLQIAAISRELGDPEQAIAALESLVDDHGSYRLAELGDDGRDMAVGLHALLELADIHEKAGRPSATIDEYQRILREFPDETHHGQRAAEWVRRVVDTILEEEGRGPYERWDREAAMRLDEARRAGDAAGLEAVLRLYPNSRHAGEAVLALAELHARSGESDRGVRTLVAFLQEDRRGDWTPLVLGALSDLAHELGNDAWEARLRDRTERERPVAESLSREPERAMTLPPEPDAFRMGGGPLRLRWRTQVRTTYPLRFLEPRGGPPPEAHDLVLVMERSGLLYAFTPAGSDPVWSRIEASYQLSLGGTYHAGQLIVGTGGGVTAMHPANGVDAWSFKPPGSIRDLDFEDGLVFATATNGADGESIVLHVADARRGHPLWTLSDALPMDLDALDPVDGRLVARASTPVRFAVLDPLTGRVMHEIPFHPAAGGYAGEARGDRIVVPIERVGLEAWDLPTGQRLWTRTVRDPSEEYVDRRGTRLLDRWVVWTIETRGTTLEESRAVLCVLDRVTGETRLERPLAPGEVAYLEPDVVAAPEVFTVLARETGLELSALDPETGGEAWAVSLVPDDGSDAGVRKILLAGPELLVLVEYRTTGGERSARVVRLDRRTGRIAAVEEIDDSPANSDCDLTGTGGKVYVLKGSVLRCYDADSEPR